MFGMDSNDKYDNNRPVTPSEDDCCGNGCNPCILDFHKRLLNDWHENKLVTNKNILSQTSYTTFIIDNVMNNSEDSILINFVFKDEIKDDVALLLLPSQHIILNYSSLSRSFTPISWTRTSFRLLVKLYPNGEFSRLIKDVEIGTKIKARGPYGDFKYKRNSFQQIMMFSIGSGIAAMYPIMKTIVEDDLEETRINLVAGFRSFNCIMLCKELQNLSDYWNLKCFIHLSQNYDKDESLHGLNLNEGRLNKEIIINYLKTKNTEKTLVLVCGTSDFNRLVKTCMDDVNHSCAHIFE